jgi:hypothetical protein
MRESSYRSLRKVPGLLALLWFSSCLAGGIRASFGQGSADRLLNSPSPAPLVSVNTHCEVMVPAYCRGAYGFEVSEDGRWLAGPDPSGYSVSGRLSKRESRQLQSAAKRILGKPAKPPSDCVPNQQIPGVGESVTVRGQQRSMKLEGAGGRLNPLCARGDRSAAQLFALADSLMRRYYPRPFRRQ